MVRHERHEEYMKRRMREECDPEEQFYWSSRRNHLTAEEHTIKDLTELQYKLYSRIKTLSEENEKLKEKLNHYLNNYTPMR